MNPQYMSAKPMTPAFGYGATQRDVHAQPPANILSQNGSGQPPAMGVQRHPGPVSFQGPPGPYNANVLPPAKQGTLQPHFGISDGVVPQTNQNMGFINGAGPTPPPPLSQPSLQLRPSVNQMGTSLMQQILPQGLSQPQPGLSASARPSVRPYFPPAFNSGNTMPQPLVNQMGSMSLVDQQQMSHKPQPASVVSPVAVKSLQQVSMPPNAPPLSQTGQGSFHSQQPPMGSFAVHPSVVTGLHPPVSFTGQPAAHSQHNVAVNQSHQPHNTYTSGPPPKQQQMPPHLSSMPVHASFPPADVGVASPVTGGSYQSAPPMSNLPPPSGSNLPSSAPQYNSINGQSLPPVQTYGTAGLSQPLPPPMSNQFPGPFQNQGPPRPQSGPGGPMPPQMSGMHPGLNQPYGQMQPGPGKVPGLVQSQQQQQQQRRLDPEMMPSPIQVMEDDQKNREGVFCTNERGSVPPLVTTNFVTQDQGNCNPRFIRSSMYSVPISPDMMKQSSIPFTLTISPFASLVEGEVSPPIVNLGEMGPVRCIRCKAYMCPYMQFIDGGRRFQCNFCRATTDVPPEYFAHLDHTGHRVDKYERPELCLGSYEFVATKDYCKNNTFPLAPAFIFIIDVSYNNMRNGMVHLLCSSLKEVLANLPRENLSEESQIKVGFITYNSSVHFYNLKNCLAQPQVMVVPDVQDMFMPLLDGFLVGVQESETLIDSLLEQIPLLYADCRDTETILLPAIKAGLEALKAAERSGKLFVFHSSLPIAEAPGKLKNRDDRKLLGTDKEKLILAPQNMVYNQLGKDCVSAACSVDLFTFPNAYIDIATIGQVCRLTGGQLYKYTHFYVELDGQRFIEDLKRSVSKQVAFDAIMRVRTSTGIRPTEFYGNYFMSNTTDVELAAMDCDKAVCVEIKHDDKLTDEDAVFLQIAVLYTSVGGQRRLRIHNLSLNTCSQMADLYRNCDLDTLMNYFSKASLRNLCDQTPKQVKDDIITKCATSLACYRKNCANPSSAGQLILPECMKLLPLYANCLLKSDAISGGSDLTVDDRSFAMHALNTMDIGASLSYIYPRLIPLHDLDPSNLSMPRSLRCTVDKLKDSGVYLLENGIYMFLWIGLNVDSSWLDYVFGVPSAAQIDIDKTNLLEFDNPMSQCVRRIMSQIREERQRYLKLIIVRQRDKLEVVFKHFLVEDKGMDNSPSYVDFLCHVHKEIRNLLS